jgi:hypothetical protein
MSESAKSFNESGRFVSPDVSPTNLVNLIHLHHAAPTH